MIDDPEAQSAAIALADILCLAESNHEMQYLCTLDVNHKGWHEAEDENNEVIARWI
jgi:hypothetical protein